MGTWPAWGVALIAFVAGLGARAQGAAEFPPVWAWHGATSSGWRFGPSSWFSEHELRMQGVHRQSRDDTCGLAALATVLGALGEPVSEAELASRARMAPGGGTSVATLVRLARELGHRAAAVQSSWAGMQAYFARYAEPVIALLAVRTLHFTVWTALEEGSAVLADPVWGHRVMERATLERLWTGVVLFVRRRGHGGAPVPDGRPGSSDLAEAAQRARARWRSLVRWQQQGGLGLWGL